MLVRSLSKDNENWKLSHINQETRGYRQNLPVTSMGHHFYFQGKMFGIFADVFLWLNLESCSFNSVFLVKNVKLAMYLLLFMWHEIGEKFSMLRDKFNRKIQLVVWLVATPQTPTP